MESRKNNQNHVSKIYAAELKQSEFNKLSQFIMAEYGIKMPPEKKIMLQSRLQKRLKTLGFDNFNDYIKYLFSPHGMSEEVIHMMDVVSTNKTDFFRESIHFDFMLSSALPALSTSYSLLSSICSPGTLTPCSIEPAWPRVPEASRPAPRPRDRWASTAGSRADITGRSR